MEINEILINHIYDFDYLLKIGDLHKLKLLNKTLNNDKYIKKHIDCKIRIQKKIFEMKVICIEIRKQMALSFC
jgi:hypothetical protein